MVEYITGDPVRIVFFLDGFFQGILNYRVLKLILFIVFKVFIFYFLRNVRKGSHFIRENIVSCLVRGKLYLHFKTFGFSGLNIFSLKMGGFLTPLICYYIG